MNGKIIAINFWSLKFLPYRKEIPLLHQLKKDFEGEKYRIYSIWIRRRI